MRGGPARGAEDNTLRFDALPDINMLSQISKRSNYIRIALAHMQKVCINDTSRVKFENMVHNMLDSDRAYYGLLS
jgi:hypothetical protein